jgi:hypothetical protein
MSSLKNECFQVCQKLLCLWFEMKTLLNIVVYLPPARNVEPQKPRNTHAIIELQIELTRCKVTALWTLGLCSSQTSRDPWVSSVMSHPQCVTLATVEKAVFRMSGADVTPATVRRGHCSSVDVCPSAIYVNRNPKQFSFPLSERDWKRQWQLEVRRLS